MPTPLSLDLRRGFRHAIEEGVSGREVARRLMISAATGARLARKVRRGEPLAPIKCGRPPSDATQPLRPAIRNPAEPHIKGPFSAAC